MIKGHQIGYRLVSNRSIQYTQLLVYKYFKIFLFLFDKIRPITIKTNVEALTLSYDRNMLDICKFCVSCSQTINKLAVEAYQQRKQTKQKALSLSYHTTDVTSTQYTWLYKSCTCPILYPASQAGRSLLHGYYLFQEAGQESSPCAIT